MNLQELTIAVALTLAIYGFHGTGHGIRAAWHHIKHPYIAKLVKR